jgi:hypothetical protein
LEDVLVETEVSDHDKSYYEEQYNSDIEEYAKKYSDSEFYSENKLEISGESLSEGKITVSSEDNLGVYPRGQVIFKADKVGYFIPDATPEIHGVSPPEVIEEGSTRQVEVTVKNVGSGESDFSASLLDCSEGFTDGGDVVDFDLSPGDQNTKSLDVSFNSGSYSRSTIQGSCTVQVLNNRDATEVLTQGVSLEGKQSTECDPDTYSKEHVDVDADGNKETKIFYCNPEGLVKEEVKVCDDDEEADKQQDGSYVCTTDPDPQEEICGNRIDDDGDGKIDEDCPTGLLDKILDFITPDSSDGILGQIHYGLSLLAGLIVGFLGYNGVRWVDGEYQVKGGFKPFASRSLSRVDRGRLLLGAIGGLAGFAAGTLVALQIPLLVQIIVIVGAAVIQFYLR